MKRHGKYEAKQGDLLPLQTGTAGWSSSQGAPPLTQPVPASLQPLEEPAMYFYGLTGHE